MRLGVVRCGRRMPFADWKRSTRFMSSTRSAPAYLSTTLPSAMNTNAGTESTPHSLAMALVSSLLSTATRAQRVNPTVLRASESTAGKMCRHPAGASLSTPMSTMASCLSHGTSMPVSKPAAAGCAIEHESMKSRRSLFDFTSVT